MGNRSVKELNKLVQDDFEEQFFVNTLNNIDETLARLKTSPRWHTKPDDEFTMLVKIIEKQQDLLHLVINRITDTDKR